MKYPWTNWTDAGTGPSRSLYFSSGSYGENIRVTATDSQETKTSSIVQVYMGATADPASPSPVSGSDRNATV